MGFRENLKQELTYNDIQVKELAAKSGINIRTINNYLSAQGSMPAADSALKIANALGVSVEYLITGKEPAKPKNLSFLPAETRSIISRIESLSPEIRSLLQKLMILPPKKRKGICKIIEICIEEIKSI